MAAIISHLSPPQTSHVHHQKPPKPPLSLYKPPTKTVHNYPNLLQLSLQNNNINQTKSIHASILKSPPKNPTFNTFLFNSILLSYLKLGFSANQAYNVFTSVEDIHPDVVTFTSIISWLGKSSNLVNSEKGVNFFLEMRNLGIYPNGYSFVGLLSVCGNILDFGLGCQVHCLAVKSGFAVECSFVSNAIMGFYGKCGCLEYVEKVFDEMFERNVCSWNTVISVFVKEAMYEEALELFRELLCSGDGVQIDDFTLSTVLTACNEYGAIMLGNQVHSLVIKLGLENNLSISNALIRFYSKCKGSIKDAVNLFDRMPVKDVITWTQMISVFMESGLVDMAENVFDKMPARNCVSYNTLLSGFCQNGIESRALLMFCRMVKEGVELDDFSLSIIINACGLYADKKTSEQIHAFVLKFAYVSNDRIESALLDMCTKCGRMTDAEEMFHYQLSLKSSIIIYTSMISGFSRNGQPYEALSLFFKGLQSETGLIIDEAVSTTVLGICSTLGFDKFGEQIHSSALKSGLLDYDIKVGNSLIGMYSKCGNMLAAIKVFENMKTRDIVSWNSLMAGYVFHKQGDNALDLWVKLKTTKNTINVFPDSITAVLVISAYTYTASNMVNECYKFFHSMKTVYNIDSNSNHYASLVGVFGKWGLLKEAEDIITQMPFEADSSVWKALLDNCTDMNTVIGKRAAKEILAKKPNDPSSYILVSNLYSASGRWDSSETTRQEMREKGFQKRPGKSWIIHENKVHSFYSRDKSHTRFKDIYSGLDILVLECLKAGYVPDTSFVLHEVEESQKRDFLLYHSAKLAVTYGLLMTKGVPIRVMKNILLCGDCHAFFKYVSMVTKREIHIRDASGFHCFVGGECSCKCK